MQEISLEHQFLPHLIHVAVSRLIRCGVDELSCNDLQLEKLDEEIYLHLAVERDPILRSPTLLTWIQSWISDPFSLAEPSDWFIELNRHIIHLLDLSMNYGFGISPLRKLWMLWKNWEMVV